MDHLTKSRLEAWRREWRDRTEMDPRDLDELAEHLLTTVETLRATGFTEEEALERAIAQVGEPDEVSAEYKKAEPRRSPWAVWSLDLRLALRQFRAHPVFTLVAAFSVGIAIASNALAFSVFNGLLFTDPGYGDSDALVEVYTGDIEALNGQSVASWPIANDLRAFDDLFEGVTAYEPLLGRMLIEGEYQVAMGEVVDVHYFDVLRVEPALGRWFTPDDARAGSRVAVVAWTTWKTRMHDRVDVLGQTIEVNGESFTVIGVAPEEFGGAIAGLAKHVWLPNWALPIGTDARADGAAPPTEDRERWLAQIKARLRTGRTAEEAQDMLTGSVPQLAAAWPESYEGVRFQILPSDDVTLSPAVDRVAYSLAGGVMITLLAVLVIACMNLAGFLLARGADRWDELQLRVALGATRGHLVGQLFLESLLIALMGGVVGLLLCAVGLELLTRIELPIPIELAFVFEIDRTVLLFSGAVTLAASLIFGLAPAWHSTRANSTRGVARGGGARVTGSGGLHALILSAQVAVSMVFLVGSGLFGRSLLAESEVDPGFRTSGAGLLTVELASGGLSQERLPGLLERLESASGGHQVLKGLVFTTRVPMGSVTSSVEVATTSDDTAEVRSVPDFSVSPGWFDEMGIPLVQGRTFEFSDGSESDPVVVVSRSLAGELAADDVALGDRLIIDGRTTRIVGVVEDIRFERPREGSTPHLYRPVVQTGAFLLSVVGIANGASSDAVSALRSVVHEVDPTIQVWSAGTLESHVDVKLLGSRIAAGLLTGSATIALLLTLVGVFGTVRYAAARRAPEMAIRLSLGASAENVVRLMVGSTVRVIAIGAGIGVLASMGLAWALRSLLFGVPPLDVWVFGGATLAIATLAATAAYVPARRIGRTDLRRLFAGEVVSS